MNVHDILETKHLLLKLFPHLILRGWYIILSFILDLCWCLINFFTSTCLFLILLLLFLYFLLFFYLLLNFEMENWIKVIFTGFSQGWQTKLKHLVLEKHAFGNGDLRSKNALSLEQRDFFGKLSLFGLFASLFFLHLFEQTHPRESMAVGALVLSAC